MFFYVAIFVAFCLGFLLAGILCAGGKYDDHRAHEILSFAVARFTAACRKHEVQTRRRELLPRGAAGEQEEDQVEEETVCVVALSEVDKLEEALTACQELRAEE